jgi:steroid 5-alpha reductase family enzyme
MSGPWFLSLGAVVAFGAALWPVSLALRNSGIVDVFWGLFFVVIAVVGLATGQGDASRGLLVALLTAAWGLRLAGHIALRGRGHGEDHRYAAMRANHGRRWGLVSLPLVFLLQPVLAWIVSLPVQAATNLRGGEFPQWTDVAGTAVFVAGFVFETVADLQLAAFRRDPANGGRVLDRGLWRLTRHPNYFGEFVLWWGLGLVGLSTGAWWSLAGPALMSFLLLRVSGVTLLERTIGERRPAYSRYAATTNAFFPGPPRPIRRTS